MKKLNFDIYIGEKMMRGQSEKVVAMIVPKFYIPKGECNLDGEQFAASNIFCFKTLYNAGTYFADLFDLIEDKDIIHATIYLNILSLYKSFKGKDIIECLDRLDKVENRNAIRSFQDLI